MNDRSIIDLAKQGVPPRDICHQLQIDAGVVYARLRAARKRGEDIPLFTTRPGEGKRAVTDRHVLLPVRLHGLLLKEAERRGETPSDTAQRLLENGLLRTTRHQASALDRSEA